MKTYRKTYDAVVIGSGPNGLAAAITMAKNGRSVIVFETQSFPGGGARSEPLTLPGFTHDVCSAVHPMALLSPFFREIPLEKYGLQWLYSNAPFAHPLKGEVLTVERSVEATAAQLGRDEKAYLKLFKPLAENAKD